MTRVIVGARLNTQQGSNQMVDAISRLVGMKTVSDPIKRFILKFNPARQYRIWQDERSSTNQAHIRIIDKQMEQYIIDKRATQLGTQSRKSDNRDILDLALMDPDYGETASLDELRDQLKSFCIHNSWLRLTVLSLCWA